jgi:hypothetical protein
MLVSLSIELAPPLDCPKISDIEVMGFCSRKLSESPQKYPHIPATATVQLNVGATWRATVGEPLRMLQTEERRDI